MKITSINDITDESMKTLSASAVHDYIKEELEKASESWCEEKTKTEKSLVEAEENYNTLQKEHTEVKESIESLETKVSTLEAEKAAKAAEERRADLLEAASIRLFGDHDHEAWCQ